MLMASFFFSTMNVLVKLLPHIPAVEIILFRSVISFLLSYFFLRRKKVPVMGNNKKLLILRGAAGAISLTLYFITLQNIPLASAVTLHYLAPIFTTVLGIFIAKEQVYWKQWLCFAISFAGIVVIEGVDTRVSALYMVLGMFAGIFAGLAYNIIRKLKTSENPLVIVFYFPLVTAPLAAIYTSFNWVSPQGMEWVVLLSIGVLTQIAQYFMTVAYQSDELSKIANINYIGIIYALGYGYVLFGETYSVLAYLGMGMVIVGVMLNVYFKNRLNAKAVRVNNT